MRLILKKTIFCLLFLPVIMVEGQEIRQGFSLSNNITSFPVTTYPQLFYSQFHPGIDIFRAWKFNKNEKNHFYWAANAGVYYHRFVQTAVRIYPSIDFYKEINSRINVNIGIGAGYGLAIENMEVFKLQDDGTYKKKFMNARSQYLVELGLGLNYSVKKDRPEGLKLFIQFKTFIQGPFVTGYVPMLPVNSLMLGLSVPFNKKVENEKYIK